jgi:hypothetical protein
MRALLVLLLLGYVTCVTFNSLSLGQYLEFSLPNAGDTVYLKIDARNETMKDAFYVRPIFESCSGNFAVFVKNCHNNCENEQLFVPSEGNKDFSIFRKGIQHPAYIDLCTSAFSKCISNNVVYFVALTAVKPDTNVQAGLIGKMICLCNIQASNNQNLVVLASN